MSKYIRARSPEHKEERMQEIKNAVEVLFENNTYHAISLSTIADQLEWSRANLYKYVKTKEEIFLDILTDKQQAYYHALMTAFPLNSNYSLEIMAEIWAGIINSHKSYLRYNSIFTTIIETNVTLSKLTSYKVQFHEDISKINLHFSEYLNLPVVQTNILLTTILFHALGLRDICENNPLAKEAAKLAGMPEQSIDFQQSMKEFIHMCLNQYCKTH